MWICLNFLVYSPVTTLHIPLTLFKLDTPQSSGICLHQVVFPQSSHIHCASLWLQSYPIFKINHKHPKKISSLGFLCIVALITFNLPLQIFLHFFFTSPTSSLKAELLSREKEHYVFCRADARFRGQTTCH